MLLWLLCCYSLLFSVSVGLCLCLIPELGIVGHWRLPIGLQNFRIFRFLFAMCLSAGQGKLQARGCSQDGLNVGLGRFQ